MPKSPCPICATLCSWTWEDAFDKFGFGDGEGHVQTARVAAVLEQNGYDVRHQYWGNHNDIIDSIMKDSVEQIPASVRVGYDDPRRYLPKRIVRLLDQHLSADQEVLP